MADPKYSMPEIERRWIVDLECVPTGGEPEVIEDLYIAGTRLRLRKWTRRGGEVVYKLAKKYGATQRGVEPMANLYLTIDEWAVLNRLEGDRITKKRIPQPGGGAIDLYPEFAVFEIEFRTIEEAESYKPPAFVDREITGDSDFSGLALARISGNAEADS